MTDMIEGIEFEVDGGYGDDGRQTRAFLTLEGDFVDACEKYLKSTDEKDPDYSRLTFRIERNEAEKLVEEIAPYLGWSRS